MADEHGYGTPTKECPSCEGRKKIKRYTQEKGVFLASVLECTRCKGTGVVDMTPDEIDFENECKKESENER